MQSRYTIDESVIVFEQVFDPEHDMIEYRVSVAGTYDIDVDFADWDIVLEQVFDDVLDVPHLI